MEGRIKEVGMSEMLKVGGDSGNKIIGTRYLSKCFGLGLYHEGENKGYIYHDPVFLRDWLKYFLGEAGEFFKGLEEVKAFASGLRIDSYDDKELKKEYRSIRKNLPLYLSEGGIPIENFWAKYPDENESGIIRIDTVEKFFGVGIKKSGERIIHWYPFKKSKWLYLTVTKD